MKKRNLLPLAGVLLFVWIIVNMDLGLVWETLSMADPLLIIAAALTTMPIIFLKALKWKVLVKSYGIDYGLLSSVRAWVVGFSLGIITPGRVGDLSRALYLKRDEHVSFGKSLTTVVLDRIIDMGVLFSLAFIGLAFLATMVIGMDSMLAMIVAFAAAFAAGVFVLVRKSTIYRVLKPLSDRFMPQRYKKLMSSVFHDFYTGMGGMSRSKITLSVLLCLAAWALAVLQLYLLSASLRIPVSLYIYFALLPVIILLEALPVSFSGIGTRDAALVYFFSVFGIAAEAAVSLSLVFLLIGYIMIGVIGLAIWARNPIRIRSRARESE